MLNINDDKRVKELRALLPPALLMEELPACHETSQLVTRARGEIAEIIHGKCDRLLVIAGPCSIHQPSAAFEYARRLRAVADRFRDELCIVMRVYFEKPRTIVGWKGLINDPYLDDTFAINEGLRLARHCLLHVAQLGLPAATEFLDPITPQFLADVVSWAAIGARTVESQVHRELASGLSMPVGFKNATGGGIQVAIDAVRSSAHRHHFLSVTKQGLAAIVHTNGNPDCHVILRGGTSGPNYACAQVQGAATALSRADLQPHVMVDCSHANSGKSHERQALVARDVAQQIEQGSRDIFGVMLESFLVDGRHDYDKTKAGVFGQSITDACMGWERTEPLFAVLADAVRKRRSG